MISVIVVMIMAKLVTRGMIIMMIIISVMTMMIIIIIPVPVMTVMIMMMKIFSGTHCGDIRPS